MRHIVEGVMAACALVLYGMGLYYLFNIVEAVFKLKGWR